MREKLILSSSTNYISKYILGDVVIKEDFVFLGAAALTAAAVPRRKGGISQQPMISGNTNIIEN